MDEGTLVSAVMTRHVVSTTPEARVEEAARTLRSHHVSGLPVLGKDGRVVGVLSENDLVRDLHAATGVDSPRGLLDLLLESAPAKGGESLLELCRHRLHRARVRELMTRPAVTVRETAPLRTAARRLRSTATNRLPVVDAEGRLVGIIARSDVVAAVSSPRARRRGGLRPSPSRGTGSRRASDPYADA